MLTVDESINIINTLNPLTKDGREYTFVDAVTLLSDLNNDKGYRIEQTNKAMNQAITQYRTRLRIKMVLSNDIIETIIKNYSESKTPMELVGDENTIQIIASEDYK